MKILVDLAVPSDAECILALQKIAFQSEAQLYMNESIAPLIQTLSELQMEMDEQLFLKATAGDRLVGSVRGRISGDTCYIGRLMVHPDFRKVGLGSELMKRMEVSLSEIKRFELFTGHKSIDNLRFYAQAGYREFYRDQVVPGLTMVFMEKMRKDPRFISSLL